MAHSNSDSKNTLVREIDNLHVRLIFDFLQKKVNSRKELIKVSKIAKFGHEMLKIQKKTFAKFAYFQYVCIIRAEIVTIFEPKMVTISARNTNIQFY